MKKKDFIVSLIGYVLILFVFFMPYSLNLIKSFLHVPLTIDSTFYVKYDYIRQGVPFYQEFFRLMDLHQLGFSWNEFLGNPFFASKGMFVTGDLFAYLAYFIYKFAVHSVPTVLFIITGIKLLVAGFAMQILLRKFNDSFYVCLILSSIYMLSGWVTTFIEQIVFISFYALIPFFIDGIERILRRKSYTQFVIVTAMIAACDFYLFVSLVVLSFIYYVIRYCMLYQFERKQFFKDLLHVLIALIIGVLMASFVLIPNMITILKAPRMNQASELQILWNPTNINAILMNFFIPMIRGNYLLYHDVRYCYYQIGIYSSCFVLLLLPQIKMFDQKKYKYYRIFIYILLVLLSSPIFGKVLHKDYSLRFTYAYPLFFLIISSDLLNEKLDHKRMINTYIILVITASLLALVIPNESMHTLLSQYLETKALLIICIVMLVELIMCLHNRINIALTVALVETMIMSSIAFTSQTNDHSEAEYIYFKDEVNEIVRQIQKDDPYFTRYHLLVGNQTGLSESSNAGLYYGIPTLSGYDSVYAYEQLDYLNSMGMYANTNWDFRLTNENQFDLLNAKYTITSKKFDPLVKEDAVELKQYGTSNFNVYRNKQANGIARSCNYFIEQSKLDEYLTNFDENAELIDAYFKEGTIIQDDLVSSLNRKYSENEICHYEGILEKQKMYLEINTINDQFIEVSVPCVLDMEVLVNGEKVDWYKVDGGFIGFEVKSGKNVITILYKNHSMVYGLIISVITCICFIGIVLKERKMNEHV